MKVISKINLYQLMIIWMSTLSALSTFLVYAENLPLDDLPEGFQNLYKFNKQTVEVHFSDQNTFYLNVEANYDTVRLNNPLELSILKDNLLANHISPNLVDDLLQTLRIGIKNTDQCQGSTSSCIVMPDTYATLFDFYTHKLYLWINPKYLEQQVESKEEYAAASKPQYSMINHFSSYASSSDTFDNYNVNLYDDTIIGLRHGYIDNRITYNTGDNKSDFDLDRSQYNYEFNKYRFRAGYNATVDSFNSTDFLVNVNNTAELAVDFGSSYNLAKQQTRATQKIFFYAPKSGVLKIYRDNRIILQRNVSGGQGYITNLELPQGRYNIVVEVTVGDQVISRESHAIFNTNDDKLAIGGFDYRLTTGVFKATDTYDDDSLEGQIHEDMDDKAFGRLLLSYRATDRILLASGFTSSQQGNSAYVGGKLYLPFDATLEAKGVLFGDNVFQVESYLSWNGLNFSYEQFDTNAKTPSKVDDLATYYYGLNSYQRYSASYSTSLPFWNAYGYMTYSYTQQQSSSSVNNNQTGSETLNYYGDDFDLNVIGGGLRFPFVINSTLDFSMNYSFSDSQSDDSYYTSVMWSIPINQLLSIRSTAALDENGFNQFSNSVETSDLIRGNDDYYLSANVTNNYTPQSSDDSSYSSTGLNGRVQKDAFDANAYVYADTNGTSNVNLGFNSSQVLTKNGITVTRKKSDAYVRIEAENNIRESASNTSRGLLVLEKNGRYSNKQTLYKDEEIIPLDIYNDYQASLDVESTDLYNSGNTRVKNYTQPGSVLEMDTKISRVVTFVSGFKDIFDNDIESLTCHGEACLTVQTVVDGVYKISVLEGMSFGLQSGQYECMLGERDNNAAMNFGSNFCLPNLATTASMSITVDDKVMTLTYLGNYKKGSDYNSVEVALRTIQSPNVEIKKKEVANNIFVYAITKDGYALTASIKNKIEDLQKYANKDEHSSNLEYALTR